MSNLLRIRPPGDKSLTHRALILGSLASGTTKVKAPLIAEDTRSLASVLRKLGVSISALGSGASVVIQGVGLDGLRTPSVPLDCGNSGTAARLLIGLLAGANLTAEITGDHSLRARPMRRVLDPLRQMGAQFEEKAGDGLPLVVRGGRLRSFDHELKVSSAQVKSAILLAALVGRTRVSIREPVQTRDHTERMLGALNVPITVEDGLVRLDAVSSFPGFTYEVAGDPSSAAFLVAAALMTSGKPVMVEGVGINPTRTAFLSVLRNMGAQVDVRQVGSGLGEPVGDILVEPGPLQGAEVDAAIVPWLIDEIPILAVLASRARGQTVFRGVGELRVKESDRLTALQSNLEAIGGTARIEGDDLVVVGKDTSYNGSVETFLDHRIAMAFATLNATDRASIELSERQSPRISYPDFFSDLERVVSRG